MADVREGTITTYFENKGYGFIDYGEEKPIFFHIRQAQQGYQPKQGDRVTFVIAEGPKGINAEQTAPVGSSSVNEDEMAA